MLKDAQTADEIAKIDEGQTQRKDEHDAAKQAEETAAQHAEAEWKQEHERRAAAAVQEQQEKKARFEQEMREKEQQRQQEHERFMLEMKHKEQAAALQARLDEFDRQMRMDEQRAKYELQRHQMDCDLKRRQIETELSIAAIHGEVAKEKVRQDGNSTQTLVEQMYKEKYHKDDQAWEEKRLAEEREAAQRREDNMIAIMRDILSFQKELGLDKGETERAYNQGRAYVDGAQAEAAQASAILRNEHDDKMLDRLMDLQ